MEIRRFILVFSDRDIFIYKSRIKGLEMNVFGLIYLDVFYKTLSDVYRLKQDDMIWFMSVDRSTDITLPIGFIFM